MTCRCNWCMRSFESDDGLEIMEDGGGWFRGCPDCGTDAYLMDVVG